MNKVKKKKKIMEGESLQDIEEWFSISPEEEGYDFIFYIYSVAKKEVKTDIVKKSDNK